MQPSAAPRISDYAAIGNGRSLGLVGRDGSLDWLCWPRFDSPSLFARLLDPLRGGSWRIAPVAPARLSRSYRGDTNVLETRFETATGTVRLVDAMPLADAATRRRVLVPEQELVRLVECVEGEVPVAMRYEPRPDFARSPANLVDGGPHGVRLARDSRLFLLRSEVPLTVSGPDSSAVFTLRRGESLCFSLSFSSEAPAVLPPLGAVAREALARTEAWWARWAARLDYEGPRRDLVVRSALVLKLLIFPPSGAIIAAPTTSLPERVGGDLNWDYRYCWLRDASLTARALFEIGYEEEAEVFVDWLLHATRLTRPRLHVLYDVFGAVVTREAELPLSGYRASRPVRIGNAAGTQVQLDVYGEVVQSAALFLAHGGRLDRDAWRMLRDFGEYVCLHSDEPDHGIWEARAETRHHTVSRAMAWAAVDALIELHERGVARGLPIELFRFNHQRLREEIETHGFNARLGSYTDELDGDRVDASLLLLAWHGFAPPDSTRMKGTLRCLRERLLAGPGLLYRTEESRGTEGAFGLCGFWFAECLARGGGTLDEACAFFEDSASYANDVGLFAEEIDPDTGEALGNFPQAFTHLGLVNAALSVSARERCLEAPPTCLHATAHAAGVPR